MLPTLSPNLQAVLDQAQTEAHAKRQDVVTTEHVLLAMLCDGQSEAARAVARQGVDLPEICSAVRGLLPAGEVTDVAGRLPLSPKAKRILDAAVKRATTSDAAEVTTQHLLLAMIDEPDTIFEDAFRLTGGDLHELTRSLRA